MPFDVAELAPGLTVARTGFTGDLGYELWTPAEKALALWDRLWASGHNYGLRPIGYAALDLARIEAGFVLCGPDLKWAQAAFMPTRGRPPFERRPVRLVHFAMGDLNASLALLPTPEAVNG